MKFILVAIVAVAVLYLLLKRPTPLKHANLSRARLEQLVDALFRRGFEGGSLVVRVRDHSFTVTKRIVSVGDVRLEGLATIPLQVANEHQMHERLAELGLKHLDRTDKGSSSVRTLSFEYGHEIALATESILIVTASGWAVNLERDAIATLHKVSEGNVNIGWKE